jgi:NADPH-dependent ferric siderophore reductase
METVSDTGLKVTRVRYPLKMRLVQVVRVERMTPHLVRVTFGGEALHDFTSASFDDHVKVFFPEPGMEAPVLPEVGPDGPVFPAGMPRPIARDYTPRHFDTERGELVIDFVLHDVGPASTWAMQARVGQHLGIGGPRGSFVVPTGFDWHLLIGDETALPAISRRLTELPAHARVAVVVEARDPSARIAFDTPADLHEVWCYRNEGAAGDPATSPLLEAVRGTYLPDGDGYVWAAGEAAAIRAVRQHLTAERGIDKSRIRAASYWKRGEANVHETIDD